MNIKLQQLKLHFVAALFTCSLQAQDHGHLNVGAAGHAQNAPLRFDNGADFTTETRYVKTLNLAAEGKYIGFFQGNISLTAMHSIDQLEGHPDLTAPAPGSFVVAEIVSVEGPAGGHFGFWDTNSTTAPTHSIPVGTLDGAFQFELSNAALGAGQPGGDAYGHIHGRRFSATVPGLYTVGFRALDTSTNGDQGSPIHAPSEILLVHFQAGVNLIGFEIIEDANVITAGLPANHVWQLESKDTIGATAWTPANAPVLGQDRITEIHDPLPGFPNRFYRLSGTPVEP